MPGSRPSSSSMLRFAAEADAVPIVSKKSDSITDDDRPASAVANAERREHAEGEVPDEREVRASTTTPSGIDRDARFGQIGGSPQSAFRMIANTVVDQDADQQRAPALARDERRTEREPDQERRGSAAS